MVRASSVFLYLGIGMAVQALGYSDITFRALFTLEATISTWAHILAWPLFLFLLGAYYLLWIGIAAILVAVGFIVYFSIGDAIGRQRRRRHLLHRRIGKIS